MWHSSHVSALTAPEPPSISFNETVRFHGHLQCAQDGAGAYLTSVLGTILVLLLLEAHRSDLYRRWSPNKRRSAGSAEGSRTTDWPTVRRPAPEEGDESDPGST